MDSTATAPDPDRRGREHNRLVGQQLASAPLTAEDKAVLDAAAHDVGEVVRSDSRE